MDAADEVAEIGLEGMACTVAAADVDEGERSCAVGCRMTGCGAVNRDDPVAPFCSFRS